MQLRRPTARLADVCWLPRFIDKARAHLEGTLPPEYSKRFCSPKGMDGSFLRHFDLTKDAFVEAVRASNGSDIAVAKWFYAQPGVTDAKVNDWNRIAPEFGRPGQPGHEVFHWAMQNIYKESPYTGAESIFEVIEADERSAS
jgi:hypothetical protein